MHASVDWAIIDSDKGSSYVFAPTIIWTIEGSLLIGQLGTDFSEIWKFPLQNSAHFASASMSCVSKTYLYLF